MFSFFFNTLRPHHSCLLFLIDSHRIILQSCQSACWADSRLGHELVLIDEIDEGDTFFEEDLKHAVNAFIGDTLLELWSYNTMLYTH